MIEDPGAPAGAAGALAAIEYCFEQGWTDGLPVVPPTRERVAEFLAAAGLAPEDVLGTIPERSRVLTAEKLAANAVMAGCLPAYMPVLAAAVQAMCHPAFGLHGPASTTAGVGILVVVNGPVAAELGLNSGQNVFGPGARANATIGRALRLLLLNAGGSREFDRGTLGHPGKYTYVLAEHEHLGPGWEPLHVQRGLEPDQSAVTVMAAEGPNQVQNHVTRTPEGILATIADRMRALGSMNLGGEQEMAVVICPEHHADLAAAGWTRRDVARWLAEHARRPLADLKRGGLVEGPVLPADEEKQVGAVARPQDLLVLCAGGQAGRFSAIIPGWSVRTASRSVTRAIPVRRGR